MPTPMSELPVIEISPDEVRLNGEPFRWPILADSITIDVRPDVVRSVTMTIAASTVVAYGLTPSAWWVSTRRPPLDLAAEWAHLDDLARRTAALRAALATRYPISPTAPTQEPTP